MRLGTVIGRVTLSKTVDELRGARWLVVSPFTREQFAAATQENGRAALPRRPIVPEQFAATTQLPPVSNEPSLVVYDDLGGGAGQTIGYIEGREAAMPFAQPTPIDAIDAALVDNIFYSPLQ